MNAMTRSLQLLAVVSLLAVSAPVRAQTADDVKYKVLVDDMLAEQKAAQPAIVKLIELVGKVRLCTPEKVGSPNLVFYLSCVPQKGDPNAEAKLDACLAAENKRLQDLLNYYAKAQSDTSWWTRLTSCSGLSDAWTAFKSAAASFFASSRQFVAETRSCLVEIGKLLLLKSADISDATLRAKFTAEMGTLDKIRTSIRALSSPTSAIAECKRAVQAAKSAYEAGKKVVAAAKEVVKEAVKEGSCLVAGKGLTRVVYWSLSDLVSLVKNGSKILNALEKYRSHAPASWQVKATGLGDYTGLLKTGRIVLKGSELAALVCSASGTYGQQVAAAMKMFADPMIVIDGFGFTPRIDGDRTLVVTLKFRVSLSDAGASGSSRDPLVLSFEIDGIIKHDTECKIANPWLTIGVKLRKADLTGGDYILNTVATKSFQSKFCLKGDLPAPKKVGGVRLPIDACAVIKACLTSNCAAPVVNSVLGQVFPIETAFKKVFGLAQKAANLSVDGKTKSDMESWVFKVDDVNVSTLKGKTGASLAGTVSMGPPGGLFKVAAKGTAEVRTTCGKSGGGTFEVVPSFDFDVGAFPKWLSERLIPAAVNPAIGKALTEGQTGLFTSFKKVEQGKFLVPWPVKITGGKTIIEWNPEIKTSLDAPKVLSENKWDSEKTKFYLQSHFGEFFLKTILKGLFVGDADACAKSGAAPIVAGDPCAVEATDEKAEKKEEKKKTGKPAKKH